MNHLHRCIDCDAEFTSDGTCFEISETGDLDCDCLRQDRCEACEPNCERCAEWDGNYVKATTTNAHGEHRCERCFDRENESAHEASLDNYYGSSGPVTVNEFCARAAADKRGNR
jgi:hypothetical protein